MDLLIASKSLARSISTKETIYSASFIMIPSTKIYELYVMAALVKTLESLNYKVSNYRKLCICMERQNNAVELFLNCDLLEVVLLIPNR